MSKRMRGREGRKGARKRIFKNSQLGRFAADPLDPLSLKIGDEERSGLCQS